MAAQMPPTPGELRQALDAVIKTGDELAAAKRGGKAAEITLAWRKLRDACEYERKLRVAHCVYNIEQASRILGAISQERKEYRGA